MEPTQADSRWIFGWEAPQSLLHSPFKLKEWNHVVVTRNGESYAMSMNGVKVRTAHSPADISDTNDSNPFIIGGMMTERGVEGRFHGAGQLPHLPSLLVGRGDNWSCMAPAPALAWKTSR